MMGLFGLVVLGVGGYLISNMLNRGGASLFGLPANVAVLAGSVLGLFFAPILGAMAPFVTFAATLGTVGSTVSLLNQNGVILIPQGLFGAQAGPPAISGDEDYIDVQAS